MGKRARRTRAKVKSLLRAHGWKENELGELKKRMTKAEARMRLLRSLAYEKAIVDAMTEHARNEIMAIEDAAFTKSIDDALKTMETSL